MMRFCMTKKVLLLITGALLLCMVPLASADQANLILTSAGNNPMDGIYVGPYTADITPMGGQTQHNQQVICDDFVDESYLNTPWTATVHTFSNLSGTLFSSMPNYVTLYEQAAWLTIQMLKQTDPTQQGYYSFAIWAIFNPNQVLAKVSSSVYNTYIVPLIQMAQSQKLDAGMFANVLIYTPKCSNGAGYCESQEFFLITSPEGGSALVYLLLAGLSCFVAMRFRVRPGRHTA